MNKQRTAGSTMLSVVIGILLVGILVIGIYALYQRSRSVSSSTPLFESTQTNETTPDQERRDNTTDAAQSNEQNTPTVSEGAVASDSNTNTHPAELAPTGPGSVLLSTMLLSILSYFLTRWIVSRRIVRSL